MTEIEQMMMSLSDSDLSKLQSEFMKPQPRRKEWGSRPVDTRMFQQYDPSAPIAVKGLTDRKPATNAREFASNLVSDTIALGLVPGQLASGVMTDPVNTTVDMVKSIPKAITEFTGIGDMDNPDLHKNLSEAWRKSPASGIATIVPIGGAAFKAGKAIAPTIASGGLGTTFAGKMAKNAPLDMLAKAEKMKAQGIPDRQIWHETGWTSAFPDGKWRWEISDDAAKLNVKQNVAYQNERLDSLLQHPEALQQYDDLGRTRTSLNWYRDASPEGYYNPNEISSRPQLKAEASTKTGLKSTTLHELGHAIQEREGFARGGSPESFVYDSGFGNPDFIKQAVKDATESSGMISKLNKEGITDIGDLYDYFKKHKESLNVNQRTALADAIAQRQNGTGFADIVKMYEDELDKAVRKRIELESGIPYFSAQRQYESLAGEAESRLTQKRMDLTPEQRRAQYPIDEFDVPVEQQIVRYGSGEAKSIPGAVEEAYRKMRDPKSKAKLEAQYPELNKNIQTISAKELSNLPSGRGEMQYVRNTTNYRNMVNRMKKYGYEGNILHSEPIVLGKDKNGNLFIEDGNHRAAAAIDSGIKEIPVKIVDRPNVNLFNKPQLPKRKQIESLPDFDGWVGNWKTGRSDYKQYYTIDGDVKDAIIP